MLVDKRFLSQLVYHLYSMQTEDECDYCNGVKAALRDYRNVFTGYCASAHELE